MEEVYQTPRKEVERLVPPVADLDRHLGLVDIDWSTPWMCLPTSARICICVREHHRSPLPLDATWAPAFPNPRLPPSHLLDRVVITLSKLQDRQPLCRLFLPLDKSSDITPLPALACVRDIDDYFPATADSRSPLMCVYDLDSWLRLWPPSPSPFLSHLVLVSSRVSSLFPLPSILDP
ncbi:hypothetical protein DFP72DRAFT_1077846 [Ephemerocybe angulata]|uniref:Uncharacterized protein n=1 Tax=Ephemerocybe angulata TaxID=980116 RepID=A0A8H6LYC5_9AGAR|nr:hypothetical protein DFP72DRAFT_1077846 [Tulosesus angulatus]